MFYFAVYLRKEGPEESEEEPTVMHRCTQCSYETKIINNIVRHVDRSHDPNRIPSQKVRQLVERGNCVFTPSNKYEMCSGICGVP